MCQLPQNKPHNGHLVALFWQVTHAEFFQTELEYTVGFNREDFDFTVGKVYSLLLKIQSGSLNVQWVYHISNTSERDIDYSHW